MSMLAPDMPIWDYCVWLAAQPRQCSVVIPSNILRDKECRRDVLFFVHGWGWRLRQNWREVLLSRYQAPLDAYITFTPEGEVVFYG